MTRSCTNSQTFGWLEGQLKLTTPRHLIIGQQTIQAVVPHEIFWAIAANQLNLTRLWKVKPYLQNGVLSHVEIAELPNPRRSSQHGSFFMVGRMTASEPDRFKLYIADTKTETLIFGSVPYRYGVGDTLYAKATLKQQSLHLDHCYSHSELAQ